MSQTPSPPSKKQVPANFSAADASQRLALSRERLRQALRHLAAPNGASNSPNADASNVAWLDRLNAIPGIGVMLDALRSWWDQHPLRLASLVLAEAGEAVVQPLAQRHPMGLVVGAFLVGAGLAWSRPWRWILTPALFAGLIPHLVSKAVSQLPPSSWIDLLASLVQPQSPPLARSQQAAPVLKPTPTSAP